MKHNISQIYISDYSNELPNFLIKTTDSIKTNFSDCKYKLYTKNNLRDFIYKNFSEDVLWAYDSLNAYAYKACLGRYCILYIFGGWYFDIAIESIRRFDVPNSLDFLCFRDDQRHAKNSWAVCDGIFWSKPKNIILKLAIEKVVQNCKEKWYGRTPLCPAGPSLFGEAIVEGNRGQNIIFGDLKRVKLPFSQKDLPFFRGFLKAKFYLPNGKAIAILKPSKGGDLKSIGVKGSNNYNDFWKNKSIYTDQQYKDMNN